MSRLYSLLIMIALVASLFAVPATTHASPSAASRIQFPAGATSVSLANQSVGAYGLNEYVLRALQGQLMSVQIQAQTPLYLAIYGITDGSVFVSSSARLASWTGNLTRDQDYAIQVINPGAATTFSLNITIPARLSFELGSTSASVISVLPDFQTIDYVLRVLEGQTLSAYTTADNQRVFMAIYAADGTVYQSAGSLLTGWTGIVPKTQDYVVRLVNQGIATNFGLFVTVPAQIQFARGATSARLSGVVSPNTNNEYVLTARAGQTMSVTITSANTQVGLTIYGEDGTPLKRYEIAPTNTWTGILPLTQRYHILAVPLYSPQSSLGFTLDISITG